RAPPGSNLREMYRHRQPPIGQPRARSARWLVHAAAAVLALLAAGGAGAQDAVRGRVGIVVPLTPGSTSDQVARLLADGIGHAVAQPVLVLNRPGASGRLAATAFKDAPADGTALMLAPMAVTVLNPMLYRRLGYDPAADFAPIAQVARFRIALAVGPEVPAASLAEFVAWARRQPVPAPCGNPGAGGLPHLFGLLLARASGVDLTHLPYNGGVQAAADLTGGRLACTLDAMSTLIGWHRSGRLRILAVSGTERAAELPEVPTFAEQGFPALDGLSWIGLYAPAATPRPLIERLARAVDDALRSSAVRQGYAQLGLLAGAATPEGLAAITRHDAMRWAPVVAAAGLSLD
ncbi:MAG: hypothetical protein J0L57_08800, partial [Burkholderiales bacterium]|nr:hypothetical protein [Burkholderiales bacterium]